MAKKETIMLDAELMNSGEIGVYDLLQAEKIDGKWDKKSSSNQGTRKIRSGYAEHHNRNFEESGSYYVLNEELNKEYLEMVEAKKPKVSKPKQKKNDKKK